MVMEVFSGVGYILLLFLSGAVEPVVLATKNKDKHVLIAAASSLNAM
jgi:hypothetical protein